MQRTIEKWKISELLDKRILFPEFQREATIWSLSQKRLLIDSILRGFDIGSIYLVKDPDDSYECLDGKQRIGALLSFCGKNRNDQKTNAFEFIPSNEVRDDRMFEDIVKATFESAEFSKYKDDFLRYDLRVVVVHYENVEDDTNLNLQFQRLQIAQILNSAEKLNAMVGGCATGFLELGA